MLKYEHGSCHTLGFAETELRLGIGFPCEPEKLGTASYGKRGYAETVDLKLNLFSLQDVNKNLIFREKIHEKKTRPPCPDYAVKSPAKVQAVGWPPVRSFRKNAMTILHHQRSNTDEKDGATATAAFVKVSMEGAPYLRKVDLKMYKTYQELCEALAKMFGSFTTTGNCHSYSQGRMVDFMNDSKVIDLVNGSEYVLTYEDKDGDWMLVGDVPWEMFVESCKRLRIMKGANAKGLEPRAMEKCKSPS